jgi:hypothetical protein
MARSSTSYKAGMPSPNPKGRPPGPTMPTLILRDAYLLAAQKAGGGGPDGLVNYLAEKAATHPAAFLSGLSRVLPLQIEARGSGHVTIEIIKRFGDEPGSGAKLINGRANGNGHKDPTAE